MQMYGKYRAHGTIVRLEAEKVSKCAPSSWDACKADDNMILPLRYKV